MQVMISQRSDPWGIDAVYHISVKIVKCRPTCAYFISACSGLPCVVTSTVEYTISVYVHNRHLMNFKEDLLLKVQTLKVQN